MNPAVATEVEVTLPDGVDLHARPAAEFVRAAVGCDAAVTVVHDGREADAKSLLAVLALGAKAGSRLRLRAEGPGAAAALEQLAGVVAGLR